MSSLSATQRTLRVLKEQGRVCAIVERWNPYGGPQGVRQDLFGIVDVLALDRSRGFVGIQCFTTAWVEHWKKLTEERAQESIDWLTTPGGHLELWGWRKVKVKRGGKALVWRPRIKEIVLNNLTLVIKDHTIDRAEHCSTLPYMTLKE